MSEKSWRNEKTFSEAYKRLVQEIGLNESQITEVAFFFQRFVGQALYEMAMRALDQGRLKGADRRFMLKIASQVDQSDKIAKQSQEAAERATRAAEEARKQALQNPSTYLLNKAGFYQELNKRLRDRRIRSWVLFYMDLRNFKSWNTQYTHAAGDLALKVFAQILTQSVRSEDSSEVFNPSGDEFAALLPLNTDQPEKVLAGAVSVLKRLCGHVDECKWADEMRAMAQRCSVLDPLGLSGDVAALPIHVDIGAACWLHADELHFGRDNIAHLTEKLVSQADKDMEAAKNIAHDSLPDSSSYQVNLYEWDEHFEVFRRLSRVSQTNLPIVPPFEE